MTLLCRRDGMLSTLPAVITRKRLTRGHSLLFLHRQNIPFFPNNAHQPPDTVPGQDRDQDQNEDAELSRVEWWSESAIQLFQAAEHITNILIGLDRCGEALLTPFTGFCTFSACMINLYFAAFPPVGCSGHQAEELSRLNFRFLDQLRGYWSMGESWVRIL